MSGAKRAAADGRPRCAWPSSAISIAYHDREWGVPLKNDRKLFEFLVLDAAQAGLSWEIILRKREGFRAAFDDFDPEKIARYDEKKIRELLANPGIIRNRLKIESAIKEARISLRRIHHLLCLHASCRDGQRPCHRLLPACRTYAPNAALENPLFRDTIN